jgi:hypothetical protein
LGCSSFNQLRNTRMGLRGRNGDSGCLHVSYHSGTKVVTTGFVLFVDSLPIAFWKDMLSSDGTEDAGRQTSGMRFGNKENPSAFGGESVLGDDRTSKDGPAASGERYEMPKMKQIGPCPE